MIRRVLAVVVAALALAAVAAPAGARARATPLSAAAPGPQLPLGHSGRWFTDASGRVVALHGLNEVYKYPPYYPSADGFGDDDATFLAANGFDAVRVGVIWKALEPQPGVYDDGYLDHIRQTVDDLGRHGIVSVLDFHQDMLNERFQGEGLPDWAVQDGGLPNPSLGFPGNYLANPATEHALDQFFANAPGPGAIGLQDRFAAAWAHVAQRFAGDTHVAGYELFNEPFPGTGWQRCATPTGCRDFDAELGALYARVDHAIRAVDPRTPILYEPNVLFNNGADTQLPALPDPHAIFAFHDYCLLVDTLGDGNGNAGCDATDDLVFVHADARAASTGDGLLMTEFGASRDFPNLAAMLARADQDMVGWLEWAYTGDDPTTSGPGSEQALVISAKSPPTGANVEADKLRLLAEPYPQVVAGTPQSYVFDPASRTFTLHYSVLRAGSTRAFPADSETDVTVPGSEYPRGFAARLQGGRPLPAAPGDPVLRIASCPGATSVTVTVGPDGASAGSCPPPRLSLSASPRRVRRGRRVAVHVLVRARLGGRMRAVSGARVSIGARHTRTGRRGRATLHVRLRRRSQVSATAPGFRGARATERVTR
jgi:endoglycosylceramidase